MRVFGKEKEENKKLEDSWTSKDLQTPLQSFQATVDGEVDENLIRNTKKNTYKQSRYKDKRTASQPDRKTH